MTKIGVYYDGNYFLHVSNYYNYDHARKRRLSVTGLHEFVRREVAKAEDTSPDLCRIVDAHYFRGRLSAQEAFQRGQVIYWDRVFDDILMSAGVITHYTLQKTQNGRQDRGIDVSLALEALDQSIHRKLDLVVLIAGDGGYVPLVRKLNALGTRVMVLSWDFEFTADNGSTMITRSSQDLLEEASYPVPMQDIINGRIKNDPKVIDGLFVASSANADRRHTGENAKEHGGVDIPPTAAGKEVIFEEPQQGEIGEMMISSVLSLKNGYGFIKYPPNNLFFHYTTVKNVDFNDLLVNDQIEFCLAHNSDGQLIATDVSLLEEEE